MFSCAIFAYFENYKFFNILCMVYGVCWGPKETLIIFCCCQWFVKLQKYLLNYAFVVCV